MVLPLSAFISLKFWKTGISGISKHYIDQTELQMNLSSEAAADVLFLACRTM